MTESVDPDPNDPDDQRQEATLGGRQEPSPDADPTAGGKRGRIGTTDSIAADEPDDGGPSIPVGGGQATAESQSVPHADPGNSSGTGGAG